MKEYRAHIVPINWGDGTTEKFKVKTKPASTMFYPLTDYEFALEFEPLNGGTSTLEALDASSELLFTERNYTMRSMRLQIRQGIS